jgi:uncharacterized cupin superfamily protein
MPIHTPATVTREVSDGTGNPCGPFEALLFSDAGGLTQFGAFVEILPPGSRSSIKHWHSAEDEMVYMLGGEVLVHEGDSTIPLRPGDVATFRAGEPAGHCLENASGAEARYLVIGTRAPVDRVTYSEDDCVLELDRAAGTKRWTTFDGKPRGTPYTTG